MDAESRGQCVIGRWRTTRRTGNLRNAIRARFELRRDMGLLCFGGKQPVAERGEARVLGAESGVKIGRVEAFGLGKEARMTVHHERTQVELGPASNFDAAGQPLTRNRHTCIGEQLARLESTYTHGATRSAGLNLMIPVGLFLLRLRDILLRNPSAFPFGPAGDDASPAQKTMMKGLEQLDAFRQIKDDAIVIFNLIRSGNKEQRKADRSYALSMLSAMAEGSYGPMHAGTAVTVEGDARFTRFVAVYYPGIDHMHAMIGSTFIARIGGGKQLGDSLAVATIPVLSKL